MWGEEFAVQSTDELIKLLEMSRALRSLAVGQAPNGCGFVQRLSYPITSNEHKPARLCPELVDLELPTGSTSGVGVQALLESRAGAGTRLNSLTIIGKVVSWDLKGLYHHVCSLKIEEGEDTD